MLSCRFFQEIFVRRSYLQHGLTVDDGAVVLDVGANVGLFALQCLLEAKTVQVGGYSKCGHADELRCFVFTASTER